MTEGHHVSCHMHSAKLYSSLPLSSHYHSTRKYEHQWKEHNMLSLQWQSF